MGLRLYVIVHTTYRRCGSLGVTACVATFWALACSNPPPEPTEDGGGEPTAGGRGGTGVGAGGEGAGGDKSGGKGGGGQAGTDSGKGGGGQAGAGPSAVSGHPDPSTTYPAYPGFTLALVEEFNAPLDLDRDPVWTWSDGGLTEGAVRFVKDGISFGDGKMKLTVTKSSTPGSDSYAEPTGNASKGFVTTKPLKSGELRTRFNNFRYGRYEVRLKAPKSDGNFIATMFTFRTPKFEDWREIDIELTADKRNTVGTNVIYANNTGAWNASIQEFATDFPEGDGAKAVPAGFDHQDGAFHTYAFEWLPDSITWYVDDVPVRVKKAGSGLKIPEKSAKIIMNLWIFATAGGFGGDPTKNVYPLQSEYDWFRFYRWNDDKTYPCASPPTCLDASDVNKSKNNADDGLDP